MVSMWARTWAKQKVPALKEYLISAEVGPPPPEAKVAKLRAAMHVLSAQYGLPLIVPTPKRTGTDEQ